MSESWEAQSRQIWAATVLAKDLDTCRSILRGDRVRAGNLDPFFLTRGLRGAPLPGPETYIEITVQILAAVHEAGPKPADFL
jgi:hypothetical protein